MCIREIPSRRIDCFFREGLRKSGADRQGRRTNPLHWRRWQNTEHGRGLSFIHCCGHCIHFVISVNDMPPSNLNIKRIVMIKRWERRELNTHPCRHLCHKSDALTITPLRTLQGLYSKDSGMSRIHWSGMWNRGQVACQVSLQRTKFKHNNDIMKKYVVKNVVGTSHT